jgi:hypothetical protein
LSLPNMHNICIFICILTIFETKYGVKIMIRTADHMPPHVHLAKAECHAKIAIETLEILESDGFSERDIKRIVAELEKRQIKLLEKWNEIQKDQIR